MITNKIGVDTLSWGPPFPIENYLDLLLFISIKHLLIVSQASVHFKYDGEISILFNLLKQSSRQSRIDGR